VSCFSQPRALRSHSWNTLLCNNCVKGSRCWYPVIQQWDERVLNSQQWNPTMPSAHYRTYGLKGPNPRIKCGTNESCKSSCTNDKIILRKKENTILNHAKTRLAHKHPSKAPKIEATFKGRMKQPPKENTDAISRKQNLPWWTPGRWTILNPRNRQLSI
jgi:hypothetical protein